MMRIDVLTLFPDYFRGPFTTSMVGRAVAKGILDLRVHNLREWTTDRHRTADDVPYGGGAGMVLKPEPIDRALRALKRGRLGVRTVYLSPQGRRLDHGLAVELSKARGLLLLCGHYEGVDERVLEAHAVEEISLGDFVLTGGEPAAAALVDAVARLIPGVVGDPRSVVQDSFADGLLDHPHYTRPPLFRGREAPPVLRSGDHARIREWRRREALRATLRKRPDLLRRAVLGAEDQRLLREIRAEERRRQRKGKEK